LNGLGYAAVNVAETLLRVSPFPCKTGLVRIGDPGRDSPVFVTGNYHLTFVRVRRALKGINAYLLVADSKGINVWCSAAGGHLTNHGVISVLKTSGIEALVDHRRVILPQLAAAGVEARVVEKRTGWRVTWGPVYAADIPAFVERGFSKTREMRETDFPWKQRLEMAVAWAFPISAVSSLIVLPFWREAVPCLVSLIWGLSLVIFLSFPLYGRLLDSGGKRLGVIFFDFGIWGLQLVLWGLFVAALLVYAVVSGDAAWGLVLRWAVASFTVLVVLSLDLKGSTPVYKSGLHEEGRARVILDPERCRGAGLCEEVCPQELLSP